MNLLDIEIEKLEREIAKLDKELTILSFGIGGCVALFLLLALWAFWQMGAWGLACVGVGALGTVGWHLYINKLKEPSHPVKDEVTK